VKFIIFLSFPSVEAWLVVVQSDKDLTIKHNRLHIPPSAFSLLLQIQDYKEKKTGLFLFVFF
jgi:hypothetical protein